MIPWKLSIQIEFKWTGMVSIGHLLKAAFNMGIIAQL